MTIMPMPRSTVATTLPTITGWDSPIDGEHLTKLVI